MQIHDDVGCGLTESLTLSEGLDRFAADVAICSSIYRIESRS